jgi:hypothetical protein
MGAVAKGAVAIPPAKSYARLRIADHRPSGSRTRPSGVYARRRIGSGSLVPADRQSAQGSRQPI